MFYFEDIAVGDRDSFGSYHVEREEVLEFAGKYDPQPFHLSDEAAAQTPFGRVAASGWHTCAIMMNMLVTHVQQDPERQQASLGAIGVDEVRWLKPCYPGDTLRCEAEVLEKTPSKSDAGRGFVKTLVKVFNQHDELIMTLKPITVVRTRAAA